MTEYLASRALAVRAAPMPLAAALAAPASKSVTNRALLVAALARGVSSLHGPLASQDTEAMIRAATGLGAEVSWSQGDLVVEGTGGRTGPRGGPIDAGLSGTTLRFAVAAATAFDRPITLTGQPPLLRRPLGALLDALRSLGAGVEDAGGFAPVTIQGPLTGGEVTVDVSGSSQFLSAVLLAAPYAHSDVIARAEGEVAGAYIEMTVDVMRRWGAEVVSEGPSRWRVTAGRPYSARTEPVEYDASAAAHLFALAAAAGGSVTVTNAAPSTLQPDARIVEVLMAFGCEVHEEEGAVSVQGPERLDPVTADLSAMPDQLPTVAVLAALAPGTSTITGAAVTRGHETDRIAAVAAELTKVGVAVQELPDGLVITGGTVTGPARLSTYDDHRLAMAFAALALRVEGIVIDDPGCVAKTYPGFWDDLAAAGAVLTPVD